ncbi:MULTISPECIES: acetoacetate--CoA ligase [Streptomyces]|uniref:Acetoacetyl-CoA synthetase n=1 Tax=Streptomyces stelliscabiei TaxID=146820 RepID=A0A8I0TNQ9_9ACTN|nr:MULTISPECIES: acetoacetate--CoA ligase [Streptomyces]KND39083.1 acetoacetyl-CoA synthetase [Streptomyces stelliscabiei]MBE1594066.1 acetoacetyl-CoA synthetase [Streptomyces stelliscabiei]MDX2520366.1 acetoacetate--CoA ligase [Streptomyces stelliscabiei]MDX3274858.1 acetoacetate--CoA ligase [Streptomyces scabiei]
MTVEAAGGFPATGRAHGAAGRAAVVAEGELLWTPGPRQVAEANVTRFADWLSRERGLRFDGYDELWNWSVTDLGGFWGALWDYFGIRSTAPYSSVLDGRDMPGARWFPGARLNYAEHVLRNERSGADAVVFGSESAAPVGLPWEDFAGRVRILATRLRALGVRPGDRVCGYLPNVPQAAIAMLATTAVGAVWASASPDFGSRGVIDRFGQLRPKVLFCVDGYRYGGKTFDRRNEVRRIADALPGLEQVIHLPVLDDGDDEPLAVGGLRWDEVLDHPPVPAEDFEFEHVPFDHPLWVLFSSGTTGLPKAIIHGHGGILLEQLKLQTFHMDLREGDRPLFFTTTGWMMWNFLISSLLVGACPVLYDGNPAHPEPDVLWRIAQDTRTTFFGASPAYVDLMTKAGIVPGERYDLSALRTVMPAGSPVSPQCTAWFYGNVKADLWIATGSGGTDCCTGFVGGVPTLPVYAGEMQARSLGVAAYAYDEHGRQVVDEVGELVITEPLPSMPVTFWGPDGDERYRRAYFEDYPGAWRHGDFFKVNARGGCFVLGRADATLNRQGVRIGTAEIYRVVEALDQVTGALVVSLDLPDEKFFMPLFVALTDGVTLDAGLQQTIRDRLRREYSPRHVPDRIIQVPAVPTTLTGKKLEVPARRILLGTPVEQAADPSTVADPRALDALARYARTQRDYPLATATV